MSSTVTEPTSSAFGAAGLRERKKVETRQALIDVATDLFDRQGYERTTIEEIAAVVGVSARTFHRYFPRKEDVVLADGTDRVERLRVSLRFQLGAASPLAAVRAVVPESVLDHRTGAEGAHAWHRLHARRRVMSATPALRALNVGVHDEWVAAIAAHAAIMVGEEPSDRWPALFGECTVAAIATAIQRWWTDPTIVLGDEYDAVLDLLRPIDRPSVLHAPAGGEGGARKPQPGTSRGQRSMSAPGAAARGGVQGALLAVSSPEEQTADEPDDFEVEIEETALASIEGRATVSRSTL